MLKKKNAFNVVGLKSDTIHVDIFKIKQKTKNKTKNNKKQKSFWIRIIKVRKGIRLKRIETKNLLKKITKDNKSITRTF